MTPRGRAMIAALLLAASAHAPGLASGTQSAAAQPSEAERERFVDTWLPRLRNESWMTAHVLAGEPADDSNLRYDDFARETLAGDLLAAFEARDDAFRDALNPPSATQGERDRVRALAKELLRAIAFEPSALADLVAHAGDEGASPALPPPESRGSPRAPGLAPHEFSDLLRARLDEDLALPDLDGERDAVRVPEERTTIPSRPLLPDELPEIRAEELLAALPVPDPESLRAQLRNLELPETLRHARAAAAPAPDLNDVLRLLASAAATALYDLCWVPAGPAEPECLDVPGIFNVPTPVDFDGDRVPDVVVDVSAPLHPRSGTDPSVTLALRRTEPFSLQPLPYLLAARLGVPAAPDLHALLGFDERTGTLPSAATLTLTVTDLLLGEPGAKVRLVTGRAGASVTPVVGLLAARATADGGIEFHERRIASLTLAPAPDVFEATLDPERLTRERNGEAVRAAAITARLSTSAPTRASLAYADEKGASGDLILAGVDPLPREVAVRAEIAGREALVTYEAPDPIEAIRFTLLQFPDVADRGTYALGARVELEDVPQRFTVRLEEGPRIEHRASGTLGRVLVATGHVTAGRYDRLTMGSATNVPAEVDVEATSQRVHVVLGEPAGVIEILDFEGTGAPVSLEGDHLAVHERIAQDGSRFRSLSARLTGLRELEAHPGSSLRGRLVADVPGPFRAAAWSLDERAREETIAYAEASNVPGEIAVEIHSSGFEYAADREIGSLEVAYVRADPAHKNLLGARVTRVPPAISSDWDLEAGRVRYEAAAPVPLVEVTASTTTGSEHRLLAASVRDLPREVRVHWNAGERKIHLDTSDPLGGVVARATAHRDGRVETDTLLRVAHLPTALSLAWSDTLVDLHADGPIGLVEASTKNHDGPFPALAGDHALLRRLADGREDASVRITGLQGFFLARDPSGGFVAEASITGGQPFSFYLLDEEEPEDRLLVSGRIGPLPRLVHAQLSRTATFRMDRNVDLEAYVETGPGDAARALPPPYTAHGLVARQAGSAMRAKLHLTGVPAYVRVNPDGPSYFEMQEFRPRIPHLVLDVQDSARDLELWARLDNPPRDIHAIELDREKGANRFHYHGSPFGPVAGTLRKGDAFLGRLEISNVPGWVDARYTQGKGITEIRHHASAPVQRIFAGLWRPTSSIYEATATITDLPRAVTLDLAKEKGGGYRISYRATEDTLDLRVLVGASLAGGDLDAQILLALEDVGRVTEATARGHEDVVLRSWPTTAVFHVEVSAEHRGHPQGSGGGGASSFRYTWSWAISLHVTVQRLRLHVEDLRELHIRPGVPVTAFPVLDAAYLFFGWDRIHVDGFLRGSFRLEAFSIPLISLRLTIDLDFDVDVKFGTYADHWASVAKLCVRVVEKACLELSSRPHFHGRSTNGFVLRGNDHEPRTARHVFINPLGIVPGWLEWSYMTFFTGEVRLRCC